MWYRGEGRDVAECPAEEGRQRRRGSAPSAGRFQTAVQLRADWNGSGQQSDVIGVLKEALACVSQKNLLYLLMMILNEAGRGTDDG